MSHDEPGHSSHPAPDARLRGRAGRRLVGAAILTGTMGLAWAAAGGQGIVSDPPVKARAEASRVVADEHPDPPVPVGWLHQLLEEGIVQAAAGDDTSLAPTPAPAEAWRTHVLATHAEVEVVQPSPEVVMVGFHEAGRPGARSLALASSPDAQEGITTVPDPKVDDALPSRVLPTRGRANGPATAIDVAMVAGEPVHAPVSGTVTSVEPYLLYGEYPDTRIVVAPDGRPDLRLVVLHVTEEQVAVGDRVEAGTDVLAASANPLPFTSQIDEYTVDASGVATPHVHLELRPASDP